MHTHHRQRMKTRVLTEGTEGLAPHELIEMLLYYSKPQGDTNPTAHRLIEAFGDVKGILQASVGDLMLIDGIGEHTAIMIQLIRESLRRYAWDSVTNPPTYNELSKIANFIRNYFIGLKNERLYMMMFNNRMNLIDCVMVSEGSVNCSDVSLRYMSQKVIQKNASNIVLAHNHPDGLAVPSSSDLHVTDVVSGHFGAIGVNLIEHLVFAGYSFQCIMRQHCGRFRVSPLSGKIETSYYDAFYDVDPEDFRFPPLFDEEVEQPDHAAEQAKWDSL